MEKRRLGTSDLEVSAIGLGCMGMSFAYGKLPDRNEMISLICEAVDRGGRAAAVTCSPARTAGWGL